MKFLILKSLLVLVVLISTNVFAHQQKAAITTVLFNDRTANIEVVHRFNLHDAEHAVRQLFDKKADIYGSEKTQQAFAEYIYQHFALYREQQQPLSLTAVGFEREGKFFWVYQETPIPTDLVSLSVRQNALQDIWASQTNTVNVEGKGPIRTLTFTASDGVLGVEFKED